MSDVMQQRLADEQLTTSLRDLIDVYGHDAVRIETIRLCGQGVILFCVWCQAPATQWAMIKDEPHSVCDAHAFNAPTQPIGSSPSRTTDAETSHAGGNRVRTSDVQRFSKTSIQGRLLMSIERSRMTSIEAAHAVVGFLDHMRIESARKRVSDLRRAGFIRDSGERRHNGQSPDESIVWCVTPEGASAVDLLMMMGWSKAKATS